MKLNRCYKLLLLSVTLMLCSMSFPGVSPAQTEPAQAGISIDFKNVELTDVIKTVAELTGKNFVHDERVRGKVTIISPDAMSLEEAYQLFLTVLSVKGFTLVESGKVNKIVPLQDAKQSNLPLSSLLQGDNYVTQLIRLKHADAKTLSSTVLLPLVSKTSNLTVYEPTNTLILTDNAANIGRLAGIIKKLDIPASLGRLEVFSLDQADAEEIAKIANSLLKKPGTSQRKQAASSSSKVSQVIAYPRTNTLLAIASADEIGLLRTLIETLDTPNNEGRSSINVYYLKHADAETLGKTLNEIMAGTKRAAASKKSDTAMEPLAITADKPTNSLLISAGPEDFALLRQVIEKLDIQRNQVYVEALILELSMDATREVGVSLQGAGTINGQSVVLGTSNLNKGSVGLGDLTPPEGSTLPSLLTRSVEGMLLGGFFEPITTTGPDGSEISVPAFSALIRLSQTSDDVNILAAPRLLTSDNEEAEIIIGSNVPIITNRLTDTTNVNAQSVAVERQDVALTLRFTPQVTEGNLVRLNVFQEITDISSNTVGDVDEVGPTLTKRQVRNTVLAEDGKTVVLGGLIGTNIQSSESKVPLLGDIPYIGRLFRSEGTATTKTNLLIFITPRVIHNAEEMAEITQKARLTSQGFQTEGLKNSVNRESLITNLNPAEETKGAPAKDE